MVPSPTSTGRSNLIRFQDEIIILIPTNPSNNISKISTIKQRLYFHRHFLYRINGIFLPFNQNILLCNEYIFNVYYVFINCCTNASHECDKNTTLQFLKKLTLILLSVSLISLSLCSSCVGPFRTEQKDNINLGLFF